MPLHGRARRRAATSRSPTSPTTTAPSAPGTLFFCVPGFTRDGHDFAPEAIAARRGRAGRRAPAGPRRAGGPGRQRPRRDGPGGGARSTATRPRARDRRRHRHERQDDDRVPVRALLEADGRQTGLLGTVKSVIGGAEHEVVRTTPEAIDLQRDVPRDARRRRPRVRDGGLLARARAPPRRRDPLRGRDLHEPDAGPPRLPPDDGGLLRRQAAAVRRGRAPRLRSSTSTTRTARGWRPSSRTRSRSRSTRRAPTTAARDVETGLARLALHRPTPADGEIELSSPLRGRFNVYNVLGAFAAARALGVPRRRRGGGDRDAPARFPGRFETGRRGPAVRGARRLRPHARTRSRTSCEAARGARPTRPAPRRVRLRRRPRSRQAPADGRDRQAAGRPRDRHLRQPALRGPRGDHRRDPRRRRRGDVEHDVDRREAIAHGDRRRASRATSS